MTNDQLQAFIAGRGRSAGQMLGRLDEADEILRWVLSGDGPVALADRAAWELVSSECRCVEIEGVLWWESRPVVPDFGDDEERVAYLEEVAQANRYLVARQLLKQHPNHPSLVRWSE